MSKNIVFRTDPDRTTIIRPPLQVFAGHDFKYLLTPGGALVDNEREYVRLLTALKSIGETRIYIAEHNVNSMDAPPFAGELSVDSDYESLKNLECAFDPVTRWTMADFLIYGDKPTWGIYICEFPAVNFIGCIEEYQSLFKKVFNIEGNGFAALDNLISDEYKQVPGLRNELIKNYFL